MAHYRTEVRDAISDVLTGLTTTGTNVFKSRVYNLQNTSLPCLAIYTRGEKIDYMTMMGALTRQTMRNMTVMVEAYVRAVSNYDVTLDNITGEVEAALAVDNTLGGLVFDIKMVSVDMDLSNDGDQPVGVALMELSVEYETKEGYATV